MPAAIPIALAVVAATSVYGAIEGNQERQHAIGAAQAQQTENERQAKEAEDLMTKQNKDSADAASRIAKTTADTQDVAQARARASSSSLQNTILTAPLGATPALTAPKTLLGG